MGLILVIRRFTLFTMSEHRDRILTCASDLLVKDGPKALSMRKLAREVGVTAPALYRHFSNKEDVLVELIGEAFKLFAQHLYRALEGGTAVERFSLTGRYYLQYALEHPQFYELLHGAHEIMGHEELPREASRHACVVSQFMVDRVREGMECGMLKQGDPQDVARTIWALSHGLVTIYNRGLLRTDEAGFRKLFLESTWMLMGGIADPDFAEAMNGEVMVAAEAEVERERSENVARDE